MMATGHHSSKTPTRIKVAFGSESGLFWGNSRRASKNCRAAVPGVTLEELARNLCKEVNGTCAGYARWGKPALVGGGPGALFQRTVAAVSGAARGTGKIPLPVGPGKI
jgi:hypothetical protein